MRIFYSCLLAFMLAIPGYSQDFPLGQWKAHFPHQSSIDIAIAGDRVWGALEASLISVDVNDLSMTRYDKSRGLSDVDMAAIAYDELTGSVIVAYANANIDIIQGNTVYNMPDVKNALITGDKTVNRIHTYNGVAWLACGFGIVKLDLDRLEISDTYFVGQGNSNLRINDIWVNDAYVFAATQDGVLRGTISPFVNLSDADNPDAWLRYTFEDNQIPEDETEVIDELGNVVYAFIGDELFKLPEGDSIWSTVTTDPGWETTGSRSFDGRLYLSQLLRMNEAIVDGRIGTFDGVSFDFPDDNGGITWPKNLDISADGTVWFSEVFGGVTRIIDNTYDRFVPNGPYKRSLLGMTWYDGSMYVASSNLNPTLPADYDFLPHGFYRSTDQFWTNYNEFNVAGLAGMEDIAVIEPIPSENKLLLGAHFNGLIEFDLENNNTVIYESPPGTNGAYRVIAMESDAAGNLWMANAYANTAPLICRKPGGEYLYFNDKTASILNRPLNSIAIDEFDQIWMSTAGSGVYVYNYNGTLEDQSDDILKFVGSNFNLPAVDVRCIASEQDGEIWIGTAAGVGVVFCPGAIINNACTVDRICIPREDTTNFCDNLLENEIINCITVDPGNRKWIGTNSGVFLQSADGLVTVHHFTEDNSPLLSNIIRSIAVNEDNGDVFIGTDKGLITFRGDATFTNKDDNKPPVVFPNPVRPDYRGPISIRNLPNNANVKIVDVSGHLVYETESIGGQATWDGLDVHGNRVHTGVYIVLSADEDGKFKRTAKFVFIH